MPLETFINRENEEYDFSKSRAGSISSEDFRNLSFLELELTSSIVTKIFKPSLEYEKIKVNKIIDSIL